ncbi:MAG: nucleotidyltransferase domain-containing protein [Bacteroidales bacterium]
MQPILRQNIDKIRKICRKHKVRQLFAFGSVCRNDFSDDSDIDFLVSFEDMPYADYADTYFNLVEKLEILLNRRVDLLTDKSIKNPYLIESLNTDKTLLYG